MHFSDTTSVGSWKDRDCTSIAHWLVKNGFQTRSTALATHLDLSGGMYAVPPSALPKFFEMVVRDLKDNKSFFLCEKRPEVSPFYLDIDYAATAPLSQDDIFRIALHLQAAARAFYSPAAFDAAAWRSRGMVAVLACDEPTAVEAQKRHFVKSGIHAIFPNLFVTEEQALALAQYAIQYLMVHQPQHANMLPWASVIDLGVYGPGKGLRMLGASKCVKCVGCLKKTILERNLCEMCCGKHVTLFGRGRRYMPLWVVEGGDTRPASNTPRFQEASDYAMFLSTILGVQKRPCGGFQQPADFVPLLRKNILAMGRILNNEIPAADMRVSILQELIRGIRQDWQHISLLKVLYTNNKKHGESYLCKTHGEGSLFCQHVMRKHSKSSIYFTVNKFGIVQRCYSLKGENEGCKGYASVSQPISDVNAFMLLFPMLKAVGTELDKEYGAILGHMWGSSGSDDMRESILRRRRAMNRINTVIPPARKRARVEVAPSLDSDEIELSD